MLDGRFHEGQIRRFGTAEKAGWVIGQDACGPQTLSILKRRV
jgi:hypothetical protein